MTRNTPRHLVFHQNRVRDNAIGRQLPLLSSDELKPQNDMAAIPWTYLQSRLLRLHVQLVQGPKLHWRYAFQIELTKFKYNMVKQAIDSRIHPSLMTTWES
jgi:hypothetical protein